MRKGTRARIGSASSMNRSARRGFILRIISESQQATDKVHNSLRGDFVWLKSGKAFANQQALQQLRTRNVFWFLDVLHARCSPTCRWGSHVSASDDDRNVRWSYTAPPARGGERREKKGDHD